MSRGQTSPSVSGPISLEGYDLVVARGCSGMFADALDRLGTSSALVGLLAIGQRSGYGRIRTVEVIEEQTPDENLAVGLGFLSSLDPGDFLVASGSDHFAYFGELMATLAHRTGLAGTAVLGRSRDTVAVSQMNYPLFCAGTTPVDIKGRGRVRSTDVPLTYMGVDFRPGDGVFADKDGIVIIPAHLLKAIHVEVVQMIEHEARIINDINQGLTGVQLAQLHGGF